jgi:hypothetical protein
MRINIDGFLFMLTFFKLFEFFSDYFGLGLFRKSHANRFKCISIKELVKNITYFIPDL